MKILMIGLGSVGQRHLRNIKSIYGEAFEIIAYRVRRLQQTFSDNMSVCEGVELETKFGLKVFTDLDKALAEKPDIVFITTITAKHMDTALKCAKVGCNLFIEKPLSHTIDGIKELQRISSVNNLTIFMGFQNRYHICVKETKKLLDENTIGSILSVTCEFGEYLETMHRYEDYRKTYMARASMGGGSILNLQMHDLDMMHYLFGKPLEVVSVLTWNSQLKIDVENAASSIYTFRNTNGEIYPIYTHTDFLQYPPAHQMKIIGEFGRIEIDLNEATLKVVVKGEVIRNEIYSNFRRNDMFIDELKDFISCVKNKIDPKIDLYQGVVSLKMGLAAKRSFHEHRIVEIEEIGE